MPVMSMRMLATLRRKTAAAPLADRLMVSLMLAPLNCMTSWLPLPPSTVSLPSPGFQTKKSLPFPRDTVSLPRPASTVSSPFPARIVSFPSPVWITSLPFPPSTVSALVPSPPPCCSVNWSSPLPRATEMAVKSVRLTRWVVAGSLPNVTTADVPSDCRSTTSGPLVPVIVSVPLDTDAVPPVSAEAAEAATAPSETDPNATAAAIAATSGRAEEVVRLCMVFLPFRSRPRCRLDSKGSKCPKRPRFGLHPAAALRLRAHGDADRRVGVVAAETAGADAAVEVFAEHGELGPNPLDRRADGAGDVDAGSFARRRGPAVAPVEAHRPAQLLDEGVDLVLGFRRPLDVVEGLGLGHVVPEVSEPSLVGGLGGRVEQRTGVAEVTAVEAWFRGRALDHGHEVEGVVLGAGLLDQLGQVAQPLGVTKPNGVGAETHPPGLPVEDQRRLGRRRLVGDRRRRLVERGQDRDDLEAVGDVPDLLAQPSRARDVSRHGQGVAPRQSRLRHPRA